MIVEVYPNAPYTSILIEGMLYGEAKCREEDKFDLELGIAIALLKARAITPHIPKWTRRTLDGRYAAIVMEYRRRYDLTRQSVAMRAQWKDSFGLHNLPSQSYITEKLAKEMLRELREEVEWQRMIRSQ